ncbi:hypothetical protein QTN25_009129 [Entamoeba marina]
MQSDDEWSDVEIFVDDDHANVIEAQPVNVNLIDTTHDDMKFDDVQSSNQLHEQNQHEESTTSQLNIVSNTNSLQQSEQLPTPTNQPMEEVIEIPTETNEISTRTNEIPIEINDDAMDIVSISSDNESNNTMKHISDTSFLTAAPTTTKDSIQDTITPSNDINVTTSVNNEDNEKLSSDIDNQQPFWNISMTIKNNLFELFGIEPFNEQERNVLNKTNHLVNVFQTASDEVIPYSVDEISESYPDSSTTSVTVTHNENIYKVPKNNDADDSSSIEVEEIPNDKQVKSKLTTTPKNTQTEAYTKKREEYSKPTIRKTKRTISKHLPLFD